MSQKGARQKAHRSRQKVLMSEKCVFVIVCKQETRSQFRTR